LAADLAIAHVVGAVNAIVAELGNQNPDAGEAIEAAMTASRELL
jgi:hypothetical protein